MRIGWLILLALIVLGLGLTSFFGRNLLLSRPTTIPKTATIPLPVPNISGTTTANKAVEYTGPVWFREVTAETGIDFLHESGNSEEKPFPAGNGSGIGALDFDLDGFVDLYFLTGTKFPVDLSQTKNINRCYRNLGSWHFRDVTSSTGLGFNGYSAGVAVGDYDNDGFPDVYVSCYGANVLYQNLGDGTFQRQEQVAGVADERWATSTAFFDANLDGLLDLYVCNYGIWTLETNKYCGDKERGIRFFCSPNSIEPIADAFFLNQGDGTFRDAIDEAKLNVKPGRGQGVVAADVNGDGWTDIYVGNDLTPNFLFLNNGDGTYRDVSDISATAFNYLGQRQAGMGVDAADANGDGLVDLFVTNFEHEHNTLYQNVSGEFFIDASHKFNLALPSMPWVGWGTAFVDFDLDTWFDIVVTNGHVDDNRHLLGQESPHEEPALLHQNNGGLRFETLGLQGGSYFAKPHVGRALAIADFDNDGDQDVVIGHQDAPPTLLDNVVRENFNGVTLRLMGTIGNRRAVGATLVARGGEHDQKSQVKGGGSYLSANDVLQVIAMPPQLNELDIEIQWPSRTTTRLTVARGKQYIVWEPIGPNGARWIEVP